MEQALPQALAILLEAQNAEGSESFRLGTPADIDPLDRFNAEVVAHLPRPGLFMRQERAFFERVFAAEGAIALAVDGGRIVAYSVAAPIGDLFAPFVETTRRAGLLFGTAVRDGARGRRLQPRMIALRCAALRACGFETVQATAAPGNHISLANLLAAGFQAMALRSLFGGDARFIVENDFTAAPAPTGPARALPLPPHGALEDHQRLLREGARGAAVVYNGSPKLLYR